MDEGIGSLTPPAVRQARLRQKSDYSFAYVAIGTLCNAILLWGGSDCVLALNSIGLEVCIEVLGHELASLVIPERLDGPTSLKGLVLKECSVSLILGAQELDPAIPGVIINEDDPVPLPRHGLSAHGAMEISVNQLEWLSGASG